jgi:hypothetical protein
MARGIAWHGRRCPCIRRGGATRSAVHGRGARTTQSLDCVRRGRPCCFQGRADMAGFSLRARLVRAVTGRNARAPVHGRGRPCHPPRACHTLRLSHSTLPTLCYTPFSRKTIIEPFSFMLSRGPVFRNAGFQTCSKALRAGQAKLVTALSGSISQKNPLLHKKTNKPRHQYPLLLA